MLDSLVQRRIGIVAAPFRLERDAGRQVQHHVGPEAGPVGLDRDVTRRLSIEILRQGRADPLPGMVLQRYPDVEVLA